MTRASNRFRVRQTRVATGEEGVVPNSLQTIPRLVPKLEREAEC